MSADVAHPVQQAEELPDLPGGEDLGSPSFGGLLSALAQPRALVRETLKLGKDFVTIAMGTDSIAPAERDKRFADPAWTSNPVYRRVAQTYVASDGVADPAGRRLRGRGRGLAGRRARPLRPERAGQRAGPDQRAARQPGGAEEGLRHRRPQRRPRARGNMVDDVRHNGGMPTQTDRSAFTVGTRPRRHPGLGGLPGRGRRGDPVHAVDAAGARAPAGRSSPRRSAGSTSWTCGRDAASSSTPSRQGLQVFMISWRNPTRKQSDWNLDTYAERVRRAIGVAKEITGSPDVNTLGFCAGGIITTTLLNHLAATGDESVHSAALRRHAARLLHPGADRRVLRDAAWWASPGASRAPGA